MIAFAAEHWEQGYKDNPRYIQWGVLRQKFVDAVESTTWYPVHQCSEEEFARFHRIEDESAIKIAQLQAAGQLKCLDWQEKDLDVSGSWRSADSWSSIEPSLFPCATRLELYDGRV